LLYVESHSSVAETDAGGRFSMVVPIVPSGGLVIEF